MISTTTNTRANQNAQNAKDHLNQAGNEARAAYDEARGNITEFANQAGRRVRGFIDDAVSEVNHATDAVSSRIRSNPLESSLVALGVGVLLGMLIRR